MNILEHIDKYQPQLSTSELLLVMVARDTREMLLMARENQKYIKATFAETTTQLSTEPVVEIVPEGEDNGAGTRTD